MIRRVVRSGVRYALLGAVLALAACETTSVDPPLPPPPPPPPGPPAVTGVTVTAAATSVAAGSTLQLTAAVAPAAASQAVTWSTSSTARATVSNSGLVSALSPGAVTITATSTADPSRTGTLQLTVTGCAPLEPPDVSNGATLPEDTCYRVQFGLVVRDGVLVVGPGVRIEFGNNGSLTINTGGRLNAAGTAAKPILFTSVDPAGAWRGVQFTNSRSASNLLHHVTIKNGGSVAWTGDTRTRAALFIVGNTLVDIQHSMIDGSGGQGLFIQNAEAEMTFLDNRIENTVVPIWVHPNAVHNLDPSTRFRDNVEHIVRVGFDNTNTLTTNQTWQPLFAAYEIQHPLRVQAALTINKSTIIMFAQDVGLTVEPSGSLTAVGEPVSGNGITFMHSFASTGSQQFLPGYWQGVRIRSASPNNRFEHVDFRSGGSAQWTGVPDSRAMVYLEGQSKAVFANTSFRASGHYGLWVPEGADISGFENNTFENNGRAMLVHANRTGHIAANNQFLPGTGTGENKVRVAIPGLNAPTVTTAQTWQAIGVPFYVTDPVFVEAALTIAPGTIVEFAQNARVETRESGSLRGAGTADNRVIFRGGEDVVGYWGGIRYNTLSANNALQYVDFLNGGSREWYGGGNAASTVWVDDDGNASLSNVTFARTGGYAMIIWNGGVSCSAVNPGGALFRIKTGLVYSNHPTC